MRQNRIANILYFLLFWKLPILLMATFRQLRNSSSDPLQHPSFEKIEILIEKVVNFSE